VTSSAIWVKGRGARSAGLRKPSGTYCRSEGSGTRTATPTVCSPRPKVSGTRSPIRSTSSKVRSTGMLGQWSSRPGYWSDPWGRRHRRRRRQTPQGGAGHKSHNEHSGTETSGGRKSDEPATTPEARADVVRKGVLDSYGKPLGVEDSKGVRIINENELHQIRQRFHDQLGKPTNVIQHPRERLSTGNQRRPQADGHVPHLQQLRRSNHRYQRRRRRRYEIPCEVTTE
jgi:hypothetical protein